MSSAVEKSTEPIRKTAAYKTLAETVIDALDDSGSAKHAGFEEKEARRLRRQKRLEKAGRSSGLGPQRVVANPEYVFIHASFLTHSDCFETELVRRLSFTKTLLGKRPGIG